MGKIPELVVLALSLGLSSCSSPLLRTDLASFISAGLSSNANLAGIAFTRAALAGSFAGATPSYGLTGIGGPTFSFSATAVSGSQHLSYTWNGAAQTWASVSGVTFASSSLAWVAGINTLKIVVATPDRQTSKIYTFTNIATAIAGNLSGTYVLIENIDLSGMNWTPIGSTSSPFTGSLDGNGHTITINIPSAPASYQGLFGVIASSGLVNNLNVVINLTNDAGEYSGGIAGQNGGTIQNCSVSGTVSSTGRWVGGITGNNAGSISDCHSTATVTGSSYVGGIAGFNTSGTCAITRCYATGTVHGTGIDVGGILGYCAGGTFSYCYATGAVSGQSSIGGLVAEVASGSISNCYARGAVSGTGVQIGGLVGLANTGCTITNCYASGAVTGVSSLGGLVGYNNSVINASYYDQQTTGRSDTGKGTPYTTAQMKAQANFSAWDFGFVWAIDGTGTINSGYPYLQCFGAGTIIP